jgi:predicted Rossmann fold nucleotide-binding protein DprA/Smf involved in DNA uptake
MIYSGGAKGVDSTSETVATSIVNGSMLLFDQKPDAEFSAGRAMNRNKFIYAPAYGIFVVESDYNKGGTWTGATEVMKNKWGQTSLQNVTK